MVIYQEIKEKTKTIEGIKGMYKEELYYAWKWFEEGYIKLSEEVEKELTYQLCLAGM